MERVDNHSLPPIWMDSVSITMRRNGLAMMRCYAFIPAIKPGSGAAPQVAAEVARLQMPTELLKSLVDLISRGLDYYPVKPVHAEAEG